MKKMLKAAAIVILVLAAALGCKKEPRWLRIYWEGEFRDSIDVTGWEKNEDVVKIDRYYYPWQGEDSISYSFYLPSLDTNIFPPYSYLVVNDRLAGVDPFDVHIESMPYKGAVLTLMRYDSNFKLLPNLVMMPVGVYSAEDTKGLDSIPRNIRLKVDIIPPILSQVSITPEVLSNIVRFRNIRVLEITLTGKDFKDDLSWTRWLCRMRGVRRVTFWVPDGTTEWEEAMIESRLRCLPKLRAVELPGYFIHVTG
ncbi:hypothetical protein CEE36_10960 [candidate division TA06 bacterium B3_TA06]|uniref:Uncharacterized protein n=1 Tax=candidate division TA06 bacterium B3_TA06 TaxID=2012487 RepID=A0A532USJ2_UNCT6|nr:MAG: hypothetical protein CEE36_10960 [candidate division TA06 bacterium B3_TA06]